VVFGDCGAGRGRDAPDQAAAAVLQATVFGAAKQNKAQRQKTNKDSKGQAARGRARDGGGGPRHRASVAAPEAGRRRGDALRKRHERPGAGLRGGGRRHGAPVRPSPPAREARLNPGRPLRISGHPQAPGRAERTPGLRETRGEQFERPGRGLPGRRRGAALAPRRPVAPAGVPAGPSSRPSRPREVMDGRSGARPDLTAILCGRSLKALTGGSEARCWAEG